MSAGPYSPHIKLLLFSPILRVHIQLYCFVITKRSTKNKSAKRLNCSNRNLLSIKYLSCITFSQFVLWITLHLETITGLFLAQPSLISFRKENLMKWMLSLDWRSVLLRTQFVKVIYAKEKTKKSDVTWVTKRGISVKAAILEGKTIKESNVIRRIWR